MLSAQQPVRVYGHVFDEESRARPGVEAVRVLLVAAQDTSIRATALSDRQGRFVIDGLAPGRYRVRMARIGYSALEWEREFKRVDDTLTVGMRPSNGGDYVCPTYSVLAPHFFVMLRDQDARPVTSGVTVVARSGAIVDTLRASGEAFRGVPPRAGRYVLEVTGNGFRETRSAPIDVHWVPGESGRALCGVPTPRVLLVERTG